MKRKGSPLNSPMADFQANPNHRTPSTSGTSEMCEGLMKKPNNMINSPQTPFKIKPMNGGKANGGANKGD